MPLKLPPKLQSPYTLAEWLDLGYDKDPKFTKTLKFLNLALISLKRTKPPTAEAFEEFTTHTAYLMKRLKKMLGDAEMPESVREFCESFFLLLKKWQKGATKVQDLLLEEDEETAAQIAGVTKAMQQADSQYKICLKNCATLAQAVDKALKDITQLATMVGKGAASPKLDAAVAQVRSEKLFKSLETARKNCAAAKDKLPDGKEIAQAGALAKEHNAPVLAALAAGCAKQRAAIEKLTAAIEAGKAKYAKAADGLLKAHAAKNPT